MELEVVEIKSKQKGKIMVSLLRGLKVSFCINFIVLLNSYCSKKVAFGGVLVKIFISR